MTSADQRLDPAPLISNAIILYRLTTRKYAELSGKGAALSAGRWNKLREEAIYTSLEVGTAVLERLAHTPKAKIPINLAVLKIKIAGNWTQSGNLSTDKDTSANRIVFPSLREAKAAYESPFHPTQTCFAVAVPSVIVPVWNVVLYPERPGFWDHVTLETVEPFDYDPRLFSEDAVLESR